MDYKLPPNPYMNENANQLKSSYFLKLVIGRRLPSLGFRDLNCFQIDIVLSDNITRFN